MLRCQFRAALKLDDESGCLKTVNLPVLSADYLQTVFFVLVFFVHNIV